MTWDQISGPLDRIILMALTWAVAKGLITTADVAPFASAALAIAGAGYGWWVNRPKAIVQSAAALPGTTVVTTPDLAAATPNQTNIVSNTEQKVSPK